MYDVINAPAIVNVTGSTKGERQLSVIRDASAAARLSLCNAKGKVGKAARESAASIGYSKLASNAAWPTCNYRPVAEFFAASLGEPIVISNRASFESLADTMEARIMKVRLSKSGGYRMDKKMGVEVPNATLQTLLDLKTLAIELREVAEEISAENKAKHEAERAAKAAQIEAPATV